MSVTAAYRWRGRDVLDFHSLAVALWAGRRTIVATSVLGALVALTVSYVVTPLYRAESVLISSAAQRVSLGYSMSTVEPSLSQATNWGGVTALARLGGDTSRAANEEAIATLLSQDLGNEFIREKNLAPLFFDSRWDAASGQWKVPVNEQPTRQDAFEYFDRNVRSVGRNGSFIILQITWRDPETAATWANDLVRRLNAHLREQAITRAATSLQALEDALETATVIDAREAIDRLVETALNEHMLANISEEYAFRVIDRALPPDKHDRVRPRRLLMLMVGTSIGFVSGMALMMLAYAVRSR